MTLGKVKWLMPRNTIDLLRCWNSAGTKQGTKNGGKAYQLLFGGQRGEKEMSGVLKAAKNQNSSEKIKLDCIMTLHFWCQEFIVEESEPILEFLESL